MTELKQLVVCCEIFHFCMSPFDKQFDKHQTYLFKVLIEKHIWSEPLYI